MKWIFLFINKNKCRDRFFFLRLCNSAFFLVAFISIFIIRHIMRSDVQTKRTLTIYTNIFTLSHRSQTMIILNESSLWHTHSSICLKHLICIGQNLRLVQLVLVSLWCFFFLSFFRYVSVFRTHKYMIESALKVKMFQTADCVYIIMRREIYENYSGSDLVKWSSSLSVRTTQTI